jgi:predicted amidohydrolase
VVRRYSILSIAVLMPLLCVGSPLLHKSVPIAICQILVIDSDREGNFRRIENALKQAHLGHAQIAVFPESSILGWENPEAYYLADPIPGPDSDRLGLLARKYGLAIAIGLDEEEGDHLLIRPFF